MGNIRRRTIYIATIVAALAMAGGFAVAAIGGGLTQGTTTSFDTGSFTVSQDTIYAQNPYTVAAVNGGGVNSATATGVISGSGNVYVSGTGSPSVAGDVWIELGFSGTAPAAGASDVFLIELNDQTVTVQVTVTVAGGNTENLNIWIDDGALGTADASGGSITITGT